MCAEEFCAMTAQDLTSNGCGIVKSTALTFVEVAPARNALRKKATIWMNAAGKAMTKPLTKPLQLGRGSERSLHT